LALYPVCGHQNEQQLRPDHSQKECFKLVYHLTPTNNKLCNQNAWTYASILKLGGTESILYHSEKGLTDWAKEKEQTLSNNTTHFDRALSTKLVYGIGDTYNT